MMRFDGRAIAVALALTGAGALVATVAEAVWAAIQAVLLLHGKFGLPVDAALGFVSQAYMAALMFFVVAAALFWPLASSRLPLLVFAGGLLVLVGAAYLATSRSDLDRTELAMAILLLGAVANIFLRIANWAHGKWIAGPAEKVKT